MLYDPSHYVLRCLDYLEYIDIYNERIRMFHVKDAEFRPTGRQGIYGGYQSWVNRAGRAVASRPERQPVLWGIAAASSSSARR